MGAWVRVDNDYEWVTPNASEPSVDKSDNDVVAVLLGPDGRVISHMLEREPIGYRADRWRRG